MPIVEYRQRVHPTPLEPQREMHDVMFLYNIVNGTIDCLLLLAEIHFNLPGRTRSREIFARHHYSTLYQQQSTIPRLLRSGNGIANYTYIPNFKKIGPSVWSLAMRTDRQTHTHTDTQTHTHTYGQTFFLNHFFGLRGPQNG